jgi:cytoskeletal protein CcmA (bactofilin family)
VGNFPGSASIKNESYDTVTVGGSLAAKRLTADLISVAGSATLDDCTFDSGTIGGSLTVDDLKVTSLLNVGGSLTAETLKALTLIVGGSAKIKRSDFRKSDIGGSLQAKVMTSQDLTVGGSGSFESSHIVNKFTVGGRVTAQDSAFDGGLEIGAAQSTKKSYVHQVTSSGSKSVIGIASGFDAGSTFSGPVTFSSGGTVIRSFIGGVFYGGDYVYGDCSDTVVIGGVYSGSSCKIAHEFDNCTVAEIQVNDEGNPAEVILRGKTTIAQAIVFASGDGKVTTYGAEAQVLGGVTGGEVIKK